MLELAGNEVPAEIGETVLALRVLEGVVAVRPEREVEVVAGRAFALDRLPHERGDEAVLRSNLLDRELQQMRVVGSLERVGIPQVDLPLRPEVLLVRADVRQPEGADRVLHLTDHASCVDRRRVGVDHAGLGGIVLEPVRAGAEQEELELVPAGSCVAALVELGDRALEDPARVARQQLAVEVDVGHADPGLSLPGKHLERGEVRVDLHVPELRLRAKPGLLDHLARVRDGVRPDAEIDAFLDQFLEHRQRHDLVPGDPGQVREVDPDTLDACLPRLVQARLRNLLLGDCHVLIVPDVRPPGSTDGRTTTI